MGKLAKLTKITRLSKIATFIVFGISCGVLVSVFVLGQRSGKISNKSYLGFFEEEFLGLHRELRLAQDFSLRRQRTNLAIADIYSAHETLLDGLKKWELVSGFCSGYPSKPGCDDGDSVLFNGLLCFAGVELGCKTVRDSFNDATGEWVRSPRRVTYGPLADNDAQSFSRDHMLGVLLYVSKTKDFQTYRKWTEWMRNSPKCLANFWGNCLAYSRVTHLCRSFKFGCLFLPGVNRLSDTVISLSGGGDEAWRIAEGGNLSTELILRFELMSASAGYPLHLKSVAFLLLSELGYDPEFIKTGTKELVARDPYNLFFQYLFDSSQTGATDQTRALLNQCEFVSLRNDLPRKKKSNILAGQHQWSFERDSYEKAWRDSMGWDCVFLGTLLRNRLLAFMDEPGRIAEEVTLPDLDSSSEISAH